MHIKDLMMSNEIVKNILTGLALFLVTTLANAQQGVGRQMSQDVMALVAYLELSNIGSRDIDCKGTPFEVSNVNEVIETDVRTVLNKLAYIDNKADPKDLDEAIASVKKLLVVSKDEKSVLQSTYEKSKQDNFRTYGKQGGCASMSASFRTVVQQRRLSIQQFLASKK